MAIDVIRKLILAMHHPNINRIKVTVTAEVASYLQNKKRRDLTWLETQGSMTIELYGRESALPEHLEVECQDSNGRLVEFTT
jgi:ribonuclease E